MERITQSILLIRGQKVLLDRDLAALYGVKAIVLRQQVKRNHERFPEDFLFQLTQEEAEFLVSQSVIPSRRHLGGSLPYAFTQEGVAMLSSVLRSPRAIQVNIAIMRTFVRLREMLSSHKELSAKLHELEQKYDEQFQAVFEAIRQLRACTEIPSAQPQLSGCGLRLRLSVSRYASSSATAPELGNLQFRGGRRNFRTGSDDSAGRR